jgi:hypothetical protein
LTKVEERALGFPIVRFEALHPLQMQLFSGVGPYLERGDFLKFRAHGNLDFDSALYVVI